MSNKLPKLSALLVAALLGVSSLSWTVGAAAATTDSAATKAQWAKHHPRRHQVNMRLRNQNHRIRHEVKEGDLTKAQARNLHKDDRAIRQEERDMAKQNGGHITKSEQKVLNQQENAVSHQIGK